MKTLITNFFLLLLISCNNSTEIQNLTNQTITPVLIGKSSISNPEPPLQNTLIINQMQWNQLLASLNAVKNVSINFTETNVDFNNYDVIAVFRNPISNTTSSIDITNVTENQTNRIVTVQKLRDGISADVAQPFHIVKIPKSTKPVVFQ